VIETSLVAIKHVAIKPFLIAFGSQFYNGPMAIEPFFNHHPMTLNLRCLHAIEWQPKNFDR
jgi:hypothetical protein